MAADPVRTYREFVASEPLASRLRSAARDTAVRALATLPVRRLVANCIRFPYYHHVFDDERAGFARHLSYFKTLGDLLPIDDAVEYLRSPSPPSGRYFCVTFDDGYKNCLTNATPALLDHRARAAFFIPTGSLDAGVEVNQLQKTESSTLVTAVELLNWDDCRRMVGSGMSFGSHTVNHVRLKDLRQADVEAELRASKGTIERELGVPCLDFCAPWGRPGIDFTRDREPAVAERLGYRSFLTTARGRNADKPVPMCITRDHLLANWSIYQLKYFFSR